MRDLEGLFVLDLTRLLPGAVATQYLAGQGATVVKVEQPGVGDYARTLTPSLFEKTNRGKKSIAVDLKHPDGKQVLLALVRHADVLVESFRPGVMERLGLGYDTLRARNPRLIYAAITGYGQSGPLAGMAGHDLNYIAMAGLLRLNVDAAGTPVIPAFQIADLLGGSMQAVTQILLALLGRHAGGEGRYLDISMTAGAQSLLEIPLAGAGAGSTAQAVSGFFACYNVYQAQDRRWLAVGVLEGKFWEELCRRLGCEELIPDQFHPEAQPFLKARLAEIFAARPAQEWFALLRDSDCCVTPVLTVDEVAASIPAPAQTGAAPKLGEHTAELLSKYARLE
jgi:crotonobetainyl-CoA:carnitine CoA-transferase CaiB-like acyl-CoA transferase